MLRKYEMELDELKHPLMVEESSYECPDERLNSPEKIVKLLNECFRLDKKQRNMYTCLHLMQNVIRWEYLN